MFDVNGVSVCVISGFMPEGWLAPKPHYLDTKYTRKQKCHTPQSENIHKNIHPRPENNNFIKQSVY